MRYLGPTRHRRLNEAAGLVFLFAGLFLFASLATYHPYDPSWDTITGTTAVSNLTGRVGAFLSDLCLQACGLAAYAIPVLVLLLGWQWIRSTPIGTPWAKTLGAGALVVSTCAALGLGPDWKPIAGAIPAGGQLGTVAAEYLVASMNVTGAALFAAACWMVSLYMVSTFEMSRLMKWLNVPLGWSNAVIARWSAWRAKLAERKARVEPKTEEAAAKPARTRVIKLEPPIVDPLAPQPARTEPEPVREIEDIPIHMLELPSPRTEAAEAPSTPVEKEPVERNHRNKPSNPPKFRTDFLLPSTDLLQEPAVRGAFDSQELKDIAGRIKSKFEEFNVLGSVTQINPGPVVTTFEYKPEAGVKYSRITTLTEDLCLGLQAESVLIERLPGKPTVGIEVPNTKREVISFRAVLESPEFQESQSRMTIALGRDINGRIKVASLETMPHLLIAGATGAGKSVMLNAMIMSFLYKATPDEVRMIMVDPKRVELGIYEGIPHLLTPVITEPRKATYALKNAVLEMDRRLRLLAEFGVRNIDQFNKKIRKMQEEPRNLFEEEATNEDLRPLPYILILIDELADLMMLEGKNVEESVTRLAQMARAVGMHLVLATQRPSVDVITGLIKANFPAPISFRVATRVDSRTILDVMGAEHLLGKGDMLFLPPGSSRLTRVHEAFVTETEIIRVVDFWKRQGAPEYDQSYLIAPPADGETESEAEISSDE